MKKSGANNINEQILSWENHENIEITKDEKWEAQDWEDKKINRGEYKNTKFKALEQASAMPESALTQEEIADAPKSEELGLAEEDELDLPWTFAVDDNLPKQFMPDWRYIKAGEGVEITLGKNLLADENALNEIFAAPEAMDATMAEQNQNNEARENNLASAVEPRVESIPEGIKQAINNQEQITESEIKPEDNSTGEIIPTKDEAQAEDEVRELNQGPLANEVNETEEFDLVKDPQVESKTISPEAEGDNLIEDHGTDNDFAPVYDQALASTDGETLKEDNSEAKDYGEEIPMVPAVVAGKLNGDQVSGKYDPTERAIGTNGGNKGSSDSYGNNGNNGGNGNKGNNGNNGGNGGNGGKKKTRKLRYKRLIAVLLIIILPIVAYFIYDYYFSNPFAHVKNAKAMNILVLGVDKRAKDGGRSDTMMLLSLNKETKQLSILSLPRDTRVEIKKGDYEKLNHAYAYGGVKLSEKMVEQLLNVPVDYYVEIDLQAFETFIDDIGGIDVDIKKRMHYEDPYDDNGGLVIDFQPGLQHLDGLKAMEYVRYRDEEGDIGRIQRQQAFIKAVMQKVTTPEGILQLPKIISHVMDKTDTNLSTKELIKLLPLLPEIKEQGIKTYMLPGKPAYIDGVSYWLPEVVKDRNMAAKVMGVDWDFSDDEKTKKFIENYEADLPPHKYTTENGTEVYEHDDGAATGQQDDSAGQASDGNGNGE